MVAARPFQFGRFSVDQLLIPSLGGNRITFTAARSERENEDEAITGWVDDGAEPIRVFFFF